ncbi:hypothetical protein [Clostridium mediterraneense]|uniref:hypothetical protein n=1 Tax=Clostridium mediterraneense TaxID=1805472 RepID=UPI001F4666DC|nr:hypothetical protein [Clostridium mediterraneense]
MLNILYTVLMTVGLAILIFVGYSLLSRYVFSKVAVNKWILLAIAVIIFIISFIIPGTGSTIEITKVLITGIAAIFLFWFLDVSRSGNPRIKKAQKKIVIKPKAKPNRVKNKTEK